MFEHGPWKSSPENPQIKNTSILQVQVFIFGVLAGGSNASCFPETQEEYYNDSSRKLSGSSPKGPSGGLDRIEFYHPKGFLQCCKRIHFLVDLYVGLYFSQFFGRWS